MGNSSLNPPWNWLGTRCCKWSWCRACGWWSRMAPSHPSAVDLNGWNGWLMDDVSMAFSVWPVPQIVLYLFYILLGFGCEVVETCGDKLTCRFLQKVSHHVLTVQNTNITRYCRPHPENRHELPWKIRQYQGLDALRSATTWGWLPWQPGWIPHEFKRFISHHKPSIW